MVVQIIDINKKPAMGSKFNLEQSMNPTQRIGKCIKYRLYESSPINLIGTKLRICNK